MKKILFCSPRGIVGGICQWTDIILDYSKTNSVDRVELCWYYAKLSNNGLNQTLPLYKRVINGLKSYLPFVKDLKRVIANNQFDIAHFATSGNISFCRDYLALKACKKKGIRTILHLHFGCLPEVLESKSLEKRLFDLCVPYIDDYIAIDEHTYNALIRYGCKNVHFVPNPLSTIVEQIIKDIPKVKRSHNIILFAGHVVEAKGVFELVDACKQLGNVKLDIMGKCMAEMSQALKRRAGDGWESWLTIHGNRTLPQVIEAMSKCTVFVLPSYTEGFPNVIIESMACGTPIIATNVGAIPQMLDADGNKCGIIVPPKDTESLKQAISTILASDTYANELGLRASQRVREEYSISQVWNKLLNVWEA